MVEPQNPSDRRVSRRAFLSTAAATAAATTIPANVTAQSDSQEDTNRIFLAIASMNGFRKSFFQRNVRKFTGPPKAKQTAYDAKREFNSHSENWVDYVNKYSDLSGDIQVLALEFAPEAGGEEDSDQQTSDTEEANTFTVYLVADHNGSEYTSAKIVDNTDRTVDETVRLESIAADNAADELEHAYENYVKPDKPPDQAHLAYLAGKYRFGTKHVTSTILGDEL